MNEIQQKLVDALTLSAERLRKIGVPSLLTGQIERLAEEVDQPCVVAIVGRVKAGKSSFINALLGEDLAKVGSTETTATINHFRYGTAHPEKPVRCYWRSGQVTDEDRRFLDGLQGNDYETLRKADGIGYLEYRLPNPYLEQIVLVDTPGTGAVVDEHQSRMAEYLKVDKAYSQLHKELRVRHHEETQRIGSSADAVIYLIGETARVTDEAFLNEFMAATQGDARALNAIGVMAKIDLSFEVIKRREALAQKIARQLQSGLNTVIPVSSSIQRALDELLADDHARLKQIMRAFRGISKITLDEMLSDAELYHDADLEYPLSLSEREQLRSKIQWRAFTTIVQIAVDASLGEDALVTQLKAIAGFEQLHKVLDEHFIKRGHLLRCYRIVNDALHIIREVRFRYVIDAVKQEIEKKEKRERFLAFVRQTSHNPAIARELEFFIEAQLTPRMDAKNTVEEVERQIGRIKYELEDYNTDYDALQKVSATEYSALFLPGERSELLSLFGIYGMEASKRVSPAAMNLTYISERQGYWEEKSQLERNPIVCMVAEQAVRRYGLLAEALL